MSRRVTFLCVLALLAAACSEPASFEEFIRSDMAENGVYSFLLDMSDSLSSYDISLYTKVDAPVMGTVSSSSSVGLEISWKEGEAAPALTETVYLPYEGEGGGASLYRSGVKPSSPGFWTVQVRPVDPPPGFRGIGMICKRNGTR